MSLRSLSARQGWKGASRGCVSGRAPAAWISALIHERLITAQSLDIYNHCYMWADCVRFPLSLKPPILILPFPLSLSSPVLQKRQFESSNWFDGSVLVMEVMTCCPLQKAPISVDAFINILLQGIEWNNHSRHPCEEDLGFFLAANT